MLSLSVSLSGITKNRYAPSGQTLEATLSSLLALAVVIEGRTCHMVHSARNRNQNRNAVFENLRCS